MRSQVVVTAWNSALTQRVKEQTFQVDPEEKFPRVYKDIADFCFGLWEMPGVGYITMIADDGVFIKVAGLIYDCVPDFPLAMPCDQDSLNVMRVCKHFVQRQEVVFVHVRVHPLPETDPLFPVVRNGIMGFPRALPIDAYVDLRYEDGKWQVAQLLEETFARFPNRRIELVFPRFVWPSPDKGVQTESVIARWLWMDLLERKMWNRVVMWSVDPYSGIPSRIEPCFH